MNKTFKNHPALAEYFETSDGQKFYSENAAHNHSKNLDDKTVKPYTRSTDVEADNSKNLEPVLSEAEATAPVDLKVDAPAIVEPALVEVEAPADLKVDAPAIVEPALIEAEAPKVKVSTSSDAKENGSASKGSAASKKSSPKK